MARRCKLTLVIATIIFTWSLSIAPAISQGVPVLRSTCGDVDYSSPPDGVPEWSVAGASAELDVVEFELLPTGGGGPLVDQLRSEAMWRLNRAESHLVQIANHWALSPAGTCKICDMKPTAQAQANRLLSLAMAVHGEEGWNKGPAGVMGQDWPWCRPEDYPSNRVARGTMWISISGHWDLRRAGQPNSQPVAGMELEDSSLGLTARGTGWSGRGGFDGKSGYYDWRFSNGTSGRTTFTLEGQNTLNGTVQTNGGAGHGDPKYNWNFTAARYQPPAPTPPSGGGNAGCPPGTRWVDRPLGMSDCE